MGLFDNFKKAEVQSLENPNAPVSAENFLHIMGWGDFQSSAGVTVNIDNALGVPAVWAALTLYQAPWLACHWKCIAEMRRWNWCLAKPCDQSDNVVFSVAQVFV